MLVQPAALAKHCAADSARLVTLTATSTQTKLGTSLNLMCVCVYIYVHWLKAKARDTSRSSTGLRRLPSLPEVADEPDRKRLTLKS